MIIQINEYPTIPPIIERIMFWVNTKFRSGKKFLKEIGYLKEVGLDFKIKTKKIF